MTETNGRIGGEILHLYREKLETLFPGVKKVRSETEADVLCGHHENDGLPHTPSLGADLRPNGHGYKIVLNCRSQGCEYRDILKGYGITQDDLYIRVEEPEGCTMKQYARVKGLDEAYLAGEEVGLQDDSYAGRPAARIPYYDEDGRYLDKHDRWRISPAKKDGDHPIRGLSKKYGGKLTLYGRWWLPEAREAGYVLVVEGESDCHTAWSRGWIAVGVPGVRNFKEEWVAFFEGIEKIYVIIEDKATETLWEKMTSFEALRDRLYKVVL